MSDETATEQMLRVVAKSRRRHGQEFDSATLTAEADAVDRGRQAIALLRRVETQPFESWEQDRRALLQALTADGEMP